MPIPLTPIERELIHKHIPEGEQASWRRLVEGVESEGSRVEIARQLHRVLEKNFGSALERIAAESDALKRLSTLHTIASLPEDMAVEVKKAKEIVSSPEHETLLQKLLFGQIKKIIPVEKVEKLHVEGSQALKNMEYLGNLFKYHAGYKGNSGHLEIFKIIHKAFLEKGVQGLKELKYHSEEFKEALPDERLRALAEQLDSLVGEAKASAGGGADYYKAIEGKLRDYEAHAQEAKPEAALEDARQKISKEAGELEKALKEFAASPEASKAGARIKGLLEKRNYGALAKEGEALSKTSFSGRAERLRGFLVGRLKRLATLGEEASKASEAIRVAQEVAERLRGLEGKGLEEQRRVLEEIKRRHGSEELEKHAKLLSALGKPVYLDLSFFLSQVLEPSSVEGGGEVVSKITHDATHLFTLGKFEKNCQSPGVAHSQSLLGFTAHPSELTIAHFSPEGEYLGFSFAHFLKAEEGEGYALVIERSYSDHGHLKEAMRRTSEEIAQRIEDAAKKKGVSLRVFLHDQLPKGKYSVLHSPRVSKWYDVKGGEVHGGESV